MARGNSIWFWLNGQKIFGTVANVFPEMLEIWILGNEVVYIPKDSVIKTM
jgi:hypothetical protein